MFTFFSPFSPGITAYANTITLIAFCILIVSTFLYVRIKPQEKEMSLKKRLLAVAYLLMMSMSISVIMNFFCMGTMATKCASQKTQQDKQLTKMLKFHDSLKRNESNAVPDSTGATPFDVIHQQVKRKLMEDSLRWDSLQKKDFQRQIKNKNACSPQKDDKHPANENQTNKTKPEIVEFKAFGAKE